MSQIVQCPKCQSPVSVSAEQSGKKLQCPSCLKPFLAPASVSGAGGTSAEDDDWLSLSDEPPKNPVRGKTLGDAGRKADEPTSATDGTGSAVSALGSSEPEFQLAPLQDRPVSDFPAGDVVDGDWAFEAGFGQAGPSTNSDDLFDDLPPIDAGNPGGITTAAAVAAADQSEREFRVKCPVCGTVLYPKVKQVGTNLRCTDCHSQVKVPSPPKKTQAPQKTAAAGGVALADVGSTDRPADPFLKSAAELIKAAEEEPKEPEFKPAYDVPDTMGWFRSVFRIFLDLGVIFHLLALSVLIAIPAALVVSIPILAIGAVPLAMVGITLTCACGFAILMAVTNGQSKVEDWPSADPTSWFETLVFVVAAVGVSIGPPYILSGFLGATPLITVGFVMFVVYVMFPFVLLSMLDMQTITQPFSADVAKSVTRCQEDWGAFYLSAGILFGCLYAYFIFCQPTPTAIGLGVVLSIATVFLYFAMMGRLAVAIGEVVGLTVLESASEQDEEQGGSESN